MEVRAVEGLASCVLDSLTSSPIVVVFCVMLCRFF